MHRIAHWLRWNLGQVVSALDVHGTVWIGFKCVKCGKISGIHATHAPKPEQFT